ncbi:hypothetical protein [Thiorhodovibrio winogradskyi]|uniref:hypothetical protein n=1 Tax=Thiorhodovibrio winogradskyi TaxID=77007 RepID=UPI002E2D8727|nr:hypothetical protein [Thiorhodovibrio winogradskyi]
MSQATSDVQFVITLIAKKKVLGIPQGQTTFTQATRCTKLGAVALHFTAFVAILRAHHAATISKTPRLSHRRLTRAAKAAHARP